MAAIASTIEYEQRFDSRILYFFPFLWGSNMTSTLNTMPNIFYQPCAHFIFYFFHSRFIEIDSFFYFHSIFLLRYVNASWWARTDFSVDLLHFRLTTLQINDDGANKRWKHIECNKRCSYLVSFLLFVAGWLFSSPSYLSCSVDVL